jgi:hypothetical protein
VDAAVKKVERRCWPKSLGEWNPVITDISLQQAATKSSFLMVDYSIYNPTVASNLVDGGFNERKKKIISIKPFSIL